MMPLGTIREVALKGFIITGDCDEASAKLKATLDANDARFKASLDAMFKAPPPPHAPGTAGTAGQASSGWSQGTSRSRGANREDDSLRGRMRTSLRSTSR